MVWKHDTVSGTDGKPRCGWASADPLYEKYHDTEWGRPLKDDRALFELLTLEGCQAGLSWITVLRKREHYRKVYDGFDPKKIARYTPAKLKKLLADPGIIRHKGKIDASVSNAKAFLALVEREGSFAKFLWSFVGGKPKKNRPKSLKDVPAKSPESDAMAKALQKGRLQVRRLDHLLRLHAGLRHGRRPCRRLPSSSGVNLTKRIFIAALGTETNQFVPFPTGRRAYEEHGVWRGDATKHEPTNFTAPLHVWRKAAEARGWTVIEGLATFAAPSGTTVRPVYEGFRDEILAGIKAALPLDAVLINVHGAMVADGYDDCEGDLLSRVRAIVGPKVAIGAEFDLHCHLSALMLDSADVLVGYKEYPHTDTMERAAELFAIIADTVEGKVKPVMARHDCRMIAQYRTSVPPINEFVTRMKSLEGKDGILSVSLSHGFSFADVEDVGTRTLVVADGDKGKAEALAKKLGEELWDNRERYATKYLSIPEAMERAASHNQGPLVLADRADNPGSGAPGDSTFVLKALVDKQIGPALFGVMWDPMAFRIAEEAGEGRAAAHAAGRQIGRGERRSGRSRRHGEEDRARRAPALRAGDGAVGRHGAAVIRACRRGDLHAPHPDLPCRRLQGGRRRSGRLSRRRREVGAAFL